VKERIEQLPNRIYVKNVSPVYAFPNFAHLSTASFVDYSLSSLLR